VPFTISHAAAVLPLQRITRSRIPLAALMIGSMAPDFGYFLPLDLARASTHDFDGLFLFCLPVGLAMWVLFVRLLERPTIELLPAAWRERIPRSPRITARSLAIAGLGILIGAMTHIAWDAFTHGDTAVAQLFPVLNWELFEVRGRAIRTHIALQYLSSVAGLLALAYWAYSLRNAPRPAREARELRGFLTDRARILAAAMLFGTTGIAVLAAFVATAGHRLEARVFHMIISGMIAWVLAWCVVAVMVTQVAQRAAVTTRPRR
jgi:hypothetical protein